MLKELGVSYSKKAVRSAGLDCIMPIVYSPKM